MKIIVATLNAKYIHTALAIRYLKTYSEKDFSMELAEYTINDPILNIVSDLFQRKPDVLAFSCYIWNIEETLEIVALLKKVLPDLQVVFGGPEVSYDTKEWMEKAPLVDYIVMGEGEATFHHLLKEIEGQQNFCEVNGLAYRDGEEIMINHPRKKLDLNTIPSPFHFPEDMADLGKRVVYFETSRGCPYTCQFCLSSIEFGVRYFDIDRTKEDLLFLMNNGAKLIKFVDRTFNIQREYAMEMFKFLIENHGDCVFQFEITADIMPPDVLDYLAENAPPGVFRFEIGVQSTNDRTNDIVKRRQNLDKLSYTVSRVRESGRIDQHLDLIAGLPEEDYDSFRKTFNDIYALEPEELQLGFLKMLRGTGVRREADQYGYVFMDKAPYEVLGNRALPFSDLVRIKRVEDVLEKYWNAHRMDRTLRYIVSKEFPSPFDFYQGFGDFWEEKGWSRIGHQLEDLFTRLRLYLQTREMKHPQVVEGLMKYDYFLNFKYKPRKTWWESSLTKEVRGKVLQAVAERPDLLGEEFASLGLNERSLHKHTMVEVLDFDLPAYLASHGESIKDGKTLLVMYYNPEEQETGRGFIRTINKELEGMIWPILH
mgnify:CR=1 FL=1